MDKTQPTTKRMLNVRFILLLTLIEKWLYAWITLLAGQFYRFNLAKSLLRASKPAWTE